MWGSASDNERVYVSNNNFWHRVSWEGGACKGQQGRPLLCDCHLPALRAPALGTTTIHALVARGHP